ncbi:OSCP/delta subunit of ATPase [Paraphysoderma sedebokerense]|nr:OSCP/delta subunit of ATPase [Paraphysoderma sedebokerense]
MSFLRLSSSLRTAVRGYATAANVQVPLQLHSLDGRYATALFTAASKKKTLDAVDADIQKIRSTITKESKISSFLENPAIKRDAKLKGVQTLLSQGKYSDITTNFFKLLAENGRLGETQKILDSWSQIMSAYRGELLVSVTSAQPLDTKLLNRLKDVLGKGAYAKPGQNLIVTNKVNPAIMGGMIVEIGDKTIDLSVSSKVARIQKMLTDAV